MIEGELPLRHVGVGPGVVYEHLVHVHVCFPFLGELDLMRVEVVEWEVDLCGASRVSGV